VIKLIFCVIVLAAFSFWISEWWRKRGVAEAEEELEHARLKNEELSFRGCTALQDSENRKISEEIKNEENHV
jgi:hypothetical protein